MDVSCYLGLLDCNKKNVKQLNDYYVYALWKDGEIVYIGQTIQLESRVTTHKGDKDFDEYSYFKCEGKFQMDVLESYLINELRPEYNKELGNGYISLSKLRQRIRNLDERYRYDPKYYIRNLKSKIEETDVQLVQYKGKWSIPIKDLAKAMEHILGGEIIDTK